MRELILIGEARGKIVLSTPGKVPIKLEELGAYVLGEATFEHGVTKGGVVVYLSPNEIDVVRKALQTSQTSFGLSRLEKTCSEPLTMGEVDVALDDQEIVKQIVGDYKGPYTLGVVQQQGTCAISLRVTDLKHKFPTSVDFKGRKIQVYVDGGYKAKKERK